MGRRLLALFTAVVMMITILPITVNAQNSSEGAVGVTGVQVNSSAITAFYQGSKMTLEAIVKPLDATDQKVTWKSANTNIVSVNSETGEICGLKAGMTSVTATTHDGGFTSTIVIRVLPSVEIPEENVLPPVELSAKQAIEVTYDPGQTIDLSTLFTIDSEAGECSYSIQEGSGTGTISGNQLTVTKAGTFVIRLKAAQSATRLAGTCDSNILTVNKLAYTGIQAGSVSSAKSVTGFKIVLNEVVVAGQAVEYAMNTENTAPESDWQESAAFTGLINGTIYYFFARVKATDLVEAGTPSEGFEIKAISTNSYIIALANNKIVQAYSSSNRTPLKAAADDVLTDYEKFDLTYATTGDYAGYVGLRSIGWNGNLVAADTLESSDPELMPRSGFTANLGGWEAYKLEPQGDGTVAIRSASHNMAYVTVRSDGVLAAKSSTVGINEKFIIVTPYTPTKPTNLTLIKAQNTSVELSWTEPAYVFKTGYNVYRSTSSDGSFTKVNGDLVITNSYNDTSVNADTTYYYVVVAVNAAGESEASNQINVTTLLGAVPETPTGIRMTLGEQNQFTITWNPSADAAGYNIYSSTGRFGTFSKVNSTPITSTSYEGSGLAYYKVAAVSSFGESYLTDYVSKEQVLFGPNVYIYSPDDAMDKVNAETASIFAKQEANQFGNERYALLFKKGTYNIDFKVGFYTQVSGLGKTPLDTSIEKMTVDARWLGNNNATCNFWRSVENLTINSNTTWAVSQAAPLRRMNINGNITFDYNYGYASGGYMADSVVSGNAGSYSQQQWISRNSKWNSWFGTLWNMVFVGIDAPVPPANPVENNVTVVDKTPVVQEKPFLYLDGSDYKVFVPGLRTDSKGVSWSANDMGVGISMDIDGFYIANPQKDTSATINAALESGKSLILTPGIYRLNETIHITKADTVVLGLGLASLVPNNGIIAMKIDDVGGVKVSGIIFDAGTDTGLGVKSSPKLMEVGVKGSTTDFSGNPILLSDLFFRVGGAGIAKADISLEINSNNVIGDDFWIWRADHGAGVSWDSNITKNGLVVNGDDVTIYGLMCEHFHEYETLWNGERGRLYFYQNELPYDVPTQSVWKTPEGKNGYAAYKVAEDVEEHEAWGLGSYAVFINTSGAITLDSAIEVPNKYGVKIHNACIVNLSGESNLLSQIAHIVNDSGAGTVKNAFSRSSIAEYCNPVTQPVITPISGSYENEQIITITCADPLAIIRYTLDGTLPTLTNGYAYDGPFAIPMMDGTNRTRTTKVTAIAFKGSAVSQPVSTSISYNLALDKTAAADSVQGTNTASKAVDGNTTSTRWESAQPCPADTPGWFMVDLGKTYTMTDVVIYWQSTSTTAKNFKLQVSDDGITWTDAKVVTNNASSGGSGLVQTFTLDAGKGTGRYIKMDATVKNGIYGYSFWEFEVYGESTAH